MQDTTSFWTEIKRYEDVLVKEPDSYCFAQLAELYRKLGLVNDAIGIAERGCRIHPDFVTGRMALAQAYLDRKEKDAARAHLEQVVRAVPENLQAQKLLSQLLVEAGDVREAQAVLRTLLFFHPDDVSSQATLDSLLRMIGAPAVASEDDETRAAFSEPDSAVEGLIPLDDVEVFEEIDEAGTPSEIDEFSLGDDVAPDQPSPSREEVRDPLTTGTLAELYVSQGFVDKAIGIYRELALANPNDQTVTRRLQELEYSQEPEPTDSSPVVEAAHFSSSGPTTLREGASSPGVSETELETLERWLANITRRRSCHSGAF